MERNITNKEEKVQRGIEKKRRKAQKSHAVAQEGHATSNHLGESFVKHLYYIQQKFSDK